MFVKGDAWSLEDQCRGTQTLGPAARDMRLIHSFIHPLDSFCLFVSPTFVRSFVQSFVCLFVHSFIRSFVGSFVRSFIHSFVHLFVHLFIHSIVRSFVHSLIYLFEPAPVKVIHSLLTSSTLINF